MRGKYIRTKEIRDKMVKSHTGKKASIETKIKMSLSRKGKPFSGIKADWNGKKHKKESKEKISKSALGRKVSIETRKKISKSTKGEKSHLWRGGITKNQYNIRHSFEMRIWRESIFKRDDYTCQECGLRGVKLNAHHIKQFALILKDNNIKTLKEALQCEELWDLKNGTTLCIDCHKKTDSFLKRP